LGLFRRTLFSYILETKKIKIKKTCNRGVLKSNYIQYKYSNYTFDMNSFNITPTD